MMFCKKIKAHKTDWRLLLLLVFVCVVTGFMVLPFTFALIELPEEIPLSLVVTAQMIQLAVLALVACFFGQRMVKSTPLPGTPILNGLLNRQKQTVLPIIREACFWGLFGGLLTVVLCIPFWDISVLLLKEEMKVALWKSVLACFYGGTTEEILFRYFMMTFFVWLFGRMKLKTAGIWLAIILNGIIFGLGHIGITSGMTVITADIIIRAVLLNGSLSVIYGILYWKRGLESAMMAHFSTDVVLHVLIPHLLAPLFI